MKVEDSTEASPFKAKTTIEEEERS